jgi:hypothetical protein
MAGVLLAAFPLLLMFDTRLAFAALAGAIWLLVSKRVNTVRGVARRRVDSDYDSSI